jgi:hypothetical protein
LRSRWLPRSKMIPAEHDRILRWWWQPLAIDGHPHRRRA